MSYRLEIEIPGLPKTVNELGRKHWAVKKKHNDVWNAAISANTVGRRPQKPLRQALVILTRYSSVEPDFDNLVNSFKCVIDSLIKCGVLDDDNPKTIGHPVYMWSKCKRKDGKIKIEIVGE